ncbi:MAG: DUF697 domain-containing protein [Azospirillum sp.]|nr:DUF697 domain-containing protein [Azospirillum sp.]
MTDDDRPESAPPDAPDDQALSPEYPVSADRADAIVKTGVIAAMGLGLVPIPVFDMVAVVGAILHMVRELARHYGVDFNEVLARSISVSLIGGVLPVLATAGLSSLLKVIPGFGSLAGGASVSVLSGALTYAVGRTFVSHFEGGGTLLDLDLEAARRSFKTLVEQGRAAVVGLRAKNSD